MVQDRETLLLIQTTNRKEVMHRLSHSDISDDLEWPARSRTCWPWVTFNVTQLLQAFSRAVFRTCVQQLTRFRLTESVARSLYESSINQSINQSVFYCSA